MKNISILSIIIIIFILLFSCINNDDLGVPLGTNVYHDKEIIHPALPVWQDFELSNVGDTTLPYNVWSQKDYVFGYIVPGDTGTYTVSGQIVNDSANGTSKAFCLSYQLSTDGGSNHWGTSAVYETCIDNDAGPYGYMDLSYYRGITFWSKYSGQLPTKGLIFKVKTRDIAIFGDPTGDEPWLYDCINPNPPGKTNQNLTSSWKKFILLWTDLYLRPCPSWYHHTIPFNTAQISKIVFELHEENENSSPHSVIGNFYLDEIKLIEP